MKGWKIWNSQNFDSGCGPDGDLGNWIQIPDNFFYYSWYKWDGVSLGINFQILGNVQYAIWPSWNKTTSTKNSLNPPKGFFSVAENGPWPTAPPRFAVHIAYLGRHVEFGVFGVICCSFPLSNTALICKKKKTMPCKYFPWECPPSPFSETEKLFCWTEAKGYDHISW